MKKTIILIVAAIASCACGRFDFTEEDWELLYPEMNAHLKYLCIDEDALFDEFDDILGLSYIEYLPDAAKILDTYIQKFTSKFIYIFTRFLQFNFTLFVK